MPPARRSNDALLKELRAFGLAYPGAETKSPWPGHLDLAVNGKTFAFLGVDGDNVSISCKLPHSAEMALLLPGVAPTGYGLGKSGWVTLTPVAGEPVPVEILKAWIDESYRARAPKKLVQQLDGAAPAAPAKKAAAKKRQ